MHLRRKWRRWQCTRESVRDWVVPNPSSIRVVTSYIRCAGSDPTQIRTQNLTTLTRILFLPHIRWWQLWRTKEKMCTSPVALRRNLVDGDVADGEEAWRRWWLEIWGGLMLLGQAVPSGLVDVEDGFKICAGVGLDVETTGISSRMWISSFWVYWSLLMVLDLVIHRRRSSGMIFWQWLSTEEVLAVSLGIWSLSGFNSGGLRGALRLRRQSVSAGAGFELPQRLKQHKAMALSNAQ